MNIRKPYNFILTKKFPDKYFDWNTNEEFPHSDINEHPEWCKYEYNTNGKEICYENSNGYWVKYEYNTNNQRIYRETCDGYWQKWEYDNNGYIIYFETSDEQIIDNRI